MLEQQQPMLEMFRNFIFDPVLHWNTVFEFSVVTLPLFTDWPVKLSDSVKPMDRFLTLCTDVM